MDEPRLYFDYNGSTPPHPAVVEAFTRHFVDVVGNAGAPHAEGERARAAIALARERIARAVGAEPGEIVFTSGGTEANNWALRGTAEALGRGHFVAGRHEHASVLRVLEWLEREGHAVTWLAPDESGRIRPRDVERALRPDTRLVATMLANNETGVLQPVVEVGALCRAKGVRFFVDAVCGLGKTPIDFRALGCDLMSFAGHKVHAPKGVGALVVKEGVALAPLVLGCGQQDGRRSGSENTAGAAAFGIALELMQAGAFGTAGEHGALRDRLFDGIRARFPAAQRNGAGACLANTLNVWFPGVRGAVLQARLAARGASVSAPAEASHVLLAMGHSRARASESVRFSLGFGTTERAIDRLLELLEECLAPSNDAGSLRPQPAAGSPSQ